MSSNGRAAHRPSRKKEVVEAAIQVFADQGPQASIAEVAEACGMSQASMYYHFASRNEIMAAAVHEAAHRMELHTRTTTPEHGKLTTAEAVRTVWDWAATHPNEAKLLFVWSAPGAGLVREERRKMIDHYVGLARKRVPTPANATRLDQAIERLAARTYVSNSMGISEEWHAGRSIGGNLKRDEIVSALIDVSNRIIGTS